MIGGHESFPHRILMTHISQKQSVHQRVPKIKIHSRVVKRKPANAFARRPKPLVSGPSKRSPPRGWFWALPFLGLLRDSRRSLKCGNVANSKNRNARMACPIGKWKHGPKLAVCPSCLILSHKLNLRFALFFLGLKFGASF